MEISKSPLKSKHSIGKNQILLISLRSKRIKLLRTLKRQWKTKKIRITKVESQWKEIQTKVTENLMFLGSLITKTTT